MMILSLILSYFIGSVPTAYLVARYLFKLDIRKAGSGNIGATNAFRVMGKKWGFLVLFLDVMKGLLPVLILPALILPSSATKLTIGLSAIAGHVFPVWLKFKGGKGIATSCGVFLGLYPAAVAASLGVWIVTVILTQYVSVGSIAAAFVFSFFVWLFYGDVNGIGLTLFITFALFGFVVYTHRANIQRLLHGQENRTKLIKY